jgi:hypothetical protein
MKAEEIPIPIMCKSQHRKKNMKKGNMILSMYHSSLVTNPKDIEVNEMPDKEFKRLIF